MRPIVSFLRQKKLKSVVYLDDFLLLGRTKEECITNVAKTCALLFSLGFLFSAHKCLFPPSTICQYLGFGFDTVTMTMSLPRAKQIKLFQLINKLARKNTCTIRQFAQFIGSLAAACPAVKYGWAYTKMFEREKYLALLRSCGNYGGRMRIPTRILEFA